MSTYDPTMEFRVLGPIEVIGELGTVNLGGPQQRRLLAVLLSDPGRVLTFERLVEVLWPERDEPANARRSAITYVSRLRSALGDGLVQTTDAGYLLDVSGLSIDADRFVALLAHARTLPSDRAADVFDEALALWRGPVFGDLTDEWWARPLAKKLEELRLTAMAERVDALAAASWDGRAIAEATSLVDAHPLREQFVERAMRGLHAVGRTADALRSFQTYRTALADQTGLDPTPALVALERSIAQGAEIEPSPSDLARPLRGYVLHELLGQGSFGSVYRATQPGVARDVAVKVIRAELADDRAFVRRFEAEAQLVARLEHPHIVPLYDFWRQPGGAFLVFRLLRGGSAEDLLARDGPQSLERAGAVLEQIGGALTAAHAEHVVHRDVKPANILFDDAGLAYLADFGIAATLAGDVIVPQRWSAGSALYASPEQLRDGTDDAKADQYGLAVTIWELLTGRAPFGGRDASSVVATKLREGLGPVDEARPGISPSIAAVLSRAGAVHPDDRFPDVTQFVLAWQRAYAGSVAGETDPTRTSAGVDAGTRAQAATILGGGRPVVNPYKGLRAFREGDASDYHGRRDLVDRLTKLVDDSPFVAVVGPSGSGKSSLVLAGLVPRVRSAGGLVAIMTPGEQPFASIAAALGQLASGDQAELLSIAAIRRPDGLRAATKAIAGDDPLLVIVDQLEELWTLTGDDERQRFLASLAVPIDAGFVRVVGTVRADFFDRPLADPVLGPLASAHTFGVTPMSAAEVHDAITIPAEQVGVRWEPALVSRLVAETIDQPGSLPLLQFALAELFERRSGAMVTAESYDELGGLEGSLSRQAEETYEGFDGADRAAVRRLFSRLVTPGEGNEDTRRRVIVADLAGVSDRVVGAFVSRRLLTSDRDRSTREPTVEVAHEVLLRSWPRLRGWLAEDRSWLRELRSLSSAAATWSAGGCDDADLYRGARLAVVSELATAHTDALTELEQRFLGTSLDRAAAQEREARHQLDDKTRQNRRLRRAVIGIAAVLVLALVAGGLAVVQRRRADRQQQLALEQKAEAERQRTLARQEQATAETAAQTARTADTASQLTTLASRSLSARGSQRDLAALLAVEAWKRSPDAESKSALFGTFTFDPGFLGYLPVGDGTSLSGTAIPGTSSMLVASYARTSLGAAPAGIVDVVTGAPGVQLEPVVDGPLVDTSFAASADGRRAAELVVSENGQPRHVGVFDLATGKKVGPVIEVPDLWWNIALDATGSHVAVIDNYSGTAVVYETSSGREIARLPGVAGPPAGTYDEAGGAIAYGPDGNLYVGSRGDHLRVFEPVAYTLVRDLRVPTYASGWLLEFTRDGSSVVARGVYSDRSGTQSGSIARIDLASGTTVWQISGDDYGYGECTSFAISESTDRLWCGNYFGVIRERSFTTGARTGSTLQNQKGWVARLDVIDDPSGEVLVGLGVNSGDITRWRIDGDGPVQRRVGQGRRVLAYFPDGRTLFVGRPNGNPPPFTLDYSLWDSVTDTEIPGLPASIYAGAEGNRVVGVFADGSTGTYDVVTKRTTRFAFDLTSFPHVTAASADGSITLLGYDDGHAVAADSATGKVLQTFRIQRAGDKAAPGVIEIDISPDNQRVYLGGNGLYSFDMATGAQLAENDEIMLAGVRVSRNGLLAASRYDGSLGIFDPDTLRETTALPGARGFVQHLQFSPDGTLLIAESNDSTLSFYDVGAGVRLGDPMQFPTLLDVPSLAFRPDGLAAATNDTAGLGAVVWDLDPEHWVTAACKIAGRNLTASEWKRYLGELGDYRATCPDYPAAG